MMYMSGHRPVAVQQPRAYGAEEAMPSLIETSSPVQDSPGRERAQLGDKVGHIPAAAGADAEAGAVRTRARNRSHFTSNAQRPRLLALAAPAVGREGSVSA